IDQMSPTAYKAIGLHGGRADEDVAVAVDEAHGTGGFGSPPGEEHARALADDVDAGGANHLLDPGSKARSQGAEQAHVAPHLRNLLHDRLGEPDGAGNL